MDYGQIRGVSFETICAFHPAFALAILNGIPVRPAERIVQGVFSSGAVGQPIRDSFDQQITGYSIFAGADVTIDPTSTFAGNPLKTMSDFFLATGASGVTVTILARTSDNQDYSPIPTDTPLQMVPGILSKASGIWKMELPDNVNVEFTLTSAPSSATPPFTVWLSFAFLTLSPEGKDYLKIPALKARAQLMALLAELRGGGGNAPPPP